MSRCCKENIPTTDKGARCVACTCRCCFPDEDQFTHRDIEKLIEKACKALDKYIGETK